MKPNRNSWLDTVNPIRGLSISAAKSIFDSSRKNGSALLQKIYAEIEDCDPTLMTCVDRRAAAIAGIGWQVNARASEKDQGLAEAQRQAVDAFLSGIENLEDALEHLDLAFFRGFSHCQPVWEADNTVRRINLLDSWNFLQEKNTGKWYYNPEASTDLTGCEEITPEARLVTLTHRRPIDWPALIVYIRKALGEQDWGRYVERYGLPNFIATMHAGATDAQRDEYLKTAKAVREGQPAALPNGGSVTTVGTESRGQDPFSLFLEHQEKQIVLMATGGTLTSLAQADTGSLAGGAQMDVWRQIVARDVTVISAAINRALVRPFLKTTFPGKPVAAEFKIEAVEKPGKKETADLAVSLRNAGYTIDQSELEEAVGFKLEKDATPQPAPSGMLLNKEPPTPTKPVLRGSDEGGKTGKDLADTLQDALEAAMVEAIAGELKKPELANKKDDNGQEHDEKGLFTGDGQGGDGSGKDEGKSGTDKAQQPEFIGTPYKDSADFRKQASEVTQAQISEVVAGTSSKKIPAHVGLRVVMENPEITDGAGHKVRFLEQIVPKYESGYGRSGRQPDIKRFEHVGAAIHAVKQDKGTVLKFRGRTIPNMIDPPSGTQRIYQTPTDGGITWVFTYANEKKIRSIQERDKNNPPYDTRKKRRR